MNLTSIEIVLRQMHEGKIIYKDGELYRLYSNSNKERGWLKEPRKLGVKDKYGYNILNGSENNKTFTIKAHRLIYAYFHGIKSIEGLIVNHIDGNKSNNKIENLEVVTHQQNMLHATKLGLNKIFGKNYTSILDDNKVKEIKSMIKEGRKTKEIASLFGVSNAVIYDIKRGKNWKHV